MTVDIRSLGGNEILRGGAADVARTRESNRRRRIRRVFFAFILIAGYLAYRAAIGDPATLGPPSLPASIQPYLFPMALLIVLGGSAVLPLVLMGRSPHVLYRPSEITIGFDDVVGLGVVKEEVIKTINLFLAHKTFHDTMGGSPRRGILFEGPPGTGKTYMAKAMAREAGVPFLFVSSSAFQSMYHGQTNRKIRAYFKALRKAARDEGGAIGFIEEIDAIASARHGMNSMTAMADGANPMQIERAQTEGIAGIVNELLIQLQSFDEQTRAERFRGKCIDWINRFRTTKHQLTKSTSLPANVLVVGATNRAADLDPALLRPGRFDRSIHFALPSRSGRREIVDYYLEKKAHEPELDKEERRAQLATVTLGYSPVMIEHLLDEALVWALRSGRDAMNWDDVQQAKMTEEIGLKQPVEYTPEEKLTIATHESGHAVVAYLVGVGRKLEVLSIIKRADALGLLAHSDIEERYTKTRSELVAGIQISFGGMTAEELFFGESGTGPAGDLSAATRTAALMVGAFGMAGSLISFDAMDSGPIAQGTVARVLNDKEGRIAVDRILDRAKQEVRALLDAHRHLVVALRDQLLLRDELIGDEILDVLQEAEAEHAALNT
jgi:cell division protease FtsH